MRPMPEANAIVNDGRRSIQSIETGFPLLAALVDAGVALTLRDLAARAGMTSAKAHPYLVSFTRVGLVRPDRSGAHTSELQSLMPLSYAACCLKKQSTYAMTKGALFPTH